MEKNSEIVMLEEKKSSVYKKRGEKYIPLNIYDTLYNLKILSIDHFTDEVAIERYIPKAKCGFIIDRGKSIMALDLRPNGRKADVNGVSAYIRK